MYETLELIPYPEQSPSRTSDSQPLNLQARERSGLALKGAGLASGPAAAEHPTAFLGGPADPSPEFCRPNFLSHRSVVLTAFTYTQLPQVKLQLLPIYLDS